MCPHSVRGYSLSGSITPENMILAVSSTLMRRGRLFQRLVSLGAGTGIHSMLAASPALAADLRRHDNTFLVGSSIRAEARQLRRH